MNELDPNEWDHEALIEAQWQRTQKLTEFKAEQEKKHKEKEKKRKNNKEEKEV